MHTLRRYRPSAKILMTLYLLIYRLSEKPGPGTRVIATGYLVRKMGNAAVHYNSIHTMHDRYIIRLIDKLARVH